MKPLSFVLFLGLALALGACPAEAAKKKKKNAAPTGELAGTVVSIDKGAGADGLAMLTVSVPGAKKKAPAVQRKIELARGTKLESLQITKKQFGLKTAAVDDLKAGERVVVLTSDTRPGQADRVLIVAAKKKAKAE